MMRRNARFALIATSLAGAATLAAGALAGDNPSLAPTRSTYPSWLSPPGDATRGAKLAAPCLACHAADAPATIPVAPKLARQRQSYMFRALVAFRDGGRDSPVMQPMVQELSDQDLRDVTTFLAGALFDKPPTPNASHPAYRQALRSCTWCHGETGIGELEGMPVLAGQDPDYLANALEEYRKGVRHDPTMRGVAAGLTPADRKALAAYYAQYRWLERNK